MIPTRSRGKNVIFMALSWIIAVLFAWLYRETHGFLVGFDMLLWISIAIFVTLATIEGIRRQ